MMKFQGLVILGVFLSLSFFCAAEPEAVASDSTVNLDDLVNVIVAERDNYAAHLVNSVVGAVQGATDDSAIRSEEPSAAYTAYHPGHSHVHHGHRECRPHHHLIEKQCRLPRCPTITCFVSDETLTDMVYVGSNPYPVFVGQLNNEMLVISYDLEHERWEAFDMGTNEIIAIWETRTGTCNSENQDWEPAETLDTTEYDWVPEQCDNI